MDWTNIIIGLAPFVTKFAVDGVLKVLPKIPRWGIQLLAGGVGALATYLATLLTGETLSPALFGLLSLSSIVVNEVAKTVREGTAPS